MPAFDPADEAPRSRGVADCFHCGVSDRDRFLEQCISCRRHFCPRCARLWHGKRFCSRPCAEVFFFGGDED